MQGILMQVVMETSPRQLNPAVLRMLATERPPHLQHGVELNPSLAGLQAALDTLSIRLSEAKPIREAELGIIDPESAQHQEEAAPVAQPPRPATTPALEEQLQGARRGERHAREECLRLRRLARDDKREIERLRASKLELAARVGRRVQALELAAARLAARCAAAERRSAGVKEGLQADLTALRRRLASAEHRQRQLQLLRRLPDDERRDVALERHRRLEALECGAAAGAARPLAEGSLQASLAQLSEELRCIRSALERFDSQHTQSLL